MTSAPPVDLARLAEIRELFADETSSVFQDFFNEMPSCLDQLHQSVHQRDCQNVSERAHYLRGSSSSVGAVFVEHCAQRIEQLADSDDFSRAGTSLLCLEVELSRLHEWLNDEGLLAA